MSLPQLKLDNQICFLIYSLEHRVMDLYRPLLAPLGITYPQYLVLLVLWEESPVPVSSLTGRLKLETGTLSPLLKRMEKAGLVLRTRNPQDERSVLVSLTEKGRNMESLAATIPESLVRCLTPNPSLTPETIVPVLKSLLGAV